MDMIDIYNRLTGWEQDEEKVLAVGEIGFAYAFSHCRIDISQIAFSRACRQIIDAGFFICPMAMSKERYRGHPYRWWPSGKWREVKLTGEQQARREEAAQAKKARSARGKEKLRTYLIAKAKRADKKLKSTLETMVVKNTHYTRNDGSQTTDHHRNDGSVSQGNHHRNDGYLLSTPSGPGVPGSGVLGPNDFGKLAANRERAAKLKTDGDTFGHETLSKVSAMTKPEVHRCTTIADLDYQCACLWHPSTASTRKKAIYELRYFRGCKLSCVGCGMPEGS